MAGFAGGVYLATKIKRSSQSAAHEGEQATGVVWPRLTTLLSASHYCRIGAFPDGQSCLNLAAARLRYIAGTAWSAICYMNMRPLYQPQVVQTEAVA